MSKVLTVWISTGYVGGDKKLSVPIEDNLSEKRNSRNGGRLT